MKKATSVLLVFLSVLVAHAQGVQFEESLSWTAIKQKAMAEHKFIFLDCFATWCGPCKAMEKSVYANDTVASAMNAQFINVKVQMDTTTEDTDGVRSWYADAHMIRVENHVSAFPTFLFLSPDGTLVHKDLGYKDAQAFMALVRDALNQDKQYYTLKHKYEEGKKDYAVMPYLVNMATTFKEEKLAETVAQDYINDYLMKQKQSVIYTKENIEFIAYHIDNSKSRAFNIFLHHRDKVDQVAGLKGLAEGVVNHIIYEEDIAPGVAAVRGTRTDPDWDHMTATIDKKYGKGKAERDITAIQAWYYTGKKDWPKAVKYTVLKTEKYGFDSTGFGVAFNVNNMVYELLFLHSDDKEVLQKALEWEKMVLDLEPKNCNDIDTYANLLYKLGRKEEALEWEKKAVDGKPGDKALADNYDKMLKGQPTWIVPD